MALNFPSVAYLIGDGNSDSGGGLCKNSGRRFGLKVVSVTKMVLAEGGTFKEAAEVAILLAQAIDKGLVDWRYRTRGGVAAVLAAAAVSWWLA